MGAAFVPVPADCIISKLTEAGFVEETDPTHNHGAEKVFARANHHDPGLKVLVYTSIRGDAYNVRKKGADAIRVVLVYDYTKAGVFERYGLAKAKRVFRNGSVFSVLGRMVERMRLMYGFANEFHKRHHCVVCGSVTNAWGKCVRRDACAGFAVVKPSKDLKSVPKALHPSACARTSQADHDLP